MNVAFLIIDSENFLEQNENLVSSISMLLESYGHNVNTILSISPKNDIEKSINLLEDNANAILIMGETSLFRKFCEQKFELSPDATVFESDKKFYFIVEEFGDNFINNNVIEVLAAKQRTVYITKIFKTYGLDKYELKALLKDCIRNKNKITFKIYDDYYDGTVQIRYSSKTSKVVVDEIMINVLEILKDNLYSIKNEKIENVIIEALKSQNKTLSIAESFTGGGLARTLINVSGASGVIKEGVVAYSNESKISRLNVEPYILQEYSAVSIETVYEMAANSLLFTESDISVATTGYAGPATEDYPIAGEFFLAVGSSESIDIDKYNFDGNRNDIMNLGIKFALFQIYKKIKLNNFQEIIDHHKEYNL